MSEHQRICCSEDALAALYNEVAASVKKYHQHLCVVCMTEPLLCIAGLVIADTMVRSGDAEDARAMAEERCRLLIKTVVARMAAETAAVAH